MKPDHEYENRSRLYRVSLQFYLSDKEYDKFAYNREAFERFLIKQMHETVALNLTEI